VRISVITCVNDFEMYESCVVSSFREKSENQDVELIPVDNTSSVWSAPSAFNYGLKKANCEIVVFCHQDVIFPTNWLEKVIEQIIIVEKKYKNWAVLGTFGVSMDGKFIGSVIDPHGARHYGQLPQKAQSLDEHCLIVRKDSGINFDEELGSFHFYGTDICLQSMAMGMTSFAIDACVRHLSPGKIDAEFYKIVDKLCQKWRNRDCSLPIIETTCGIFRIKCGFRGKLAYIFANTKRSFRRRNRRFNS